MSENYVIRVVSSIPTWVPKILNSNLPSGIPEIYNSSGLISTPKVWTGSGNTVAGSITFNISSAGFSNIYSINCSIISNDAVANQGVWCIVTSSSTSSCTVKTYNTTSTGVIVLGIPVLASINTAIYTGVKNINLVVIGS